jgi:hypothetical protein
MGYRAPLIPLGEVTTWEIFGWADLYDAKGKPSYREIHTNWDSTTPGDDIERAIELGATHISLEVKQWKHGSERPKPRKFTYEEFFTRKPESQPEKE